MIFKVFEPFACFWRIDVFLRNKNVNCDVIRMFVVFKSFEMFVVKRGVLWHV